MPQELTFDIGEVAADAEVWAPDLLDSDTTILTGAMILVDASGGPRAITLPVAANTPGRMLAIKKVDNSVNAVTVDGNGSDTIDGGSDVTLSDQYDSVVLGTDGIEWFILALYP